MLLCCSVRARFDPRAFEEAVEQRRTDAHQVAQDMTAAIADGKYDPSIDNFNQGTLSDSPAVVSKDAATGPDDVSKAPAAPELLWRPERVAADYKRARKLMVVLDHEKDITGNPLLPPAAAAAADDANGAAVGEEEKGDQAGADNTAAATTSSSKLQLQLKAVDEEDVAVADDGDLTSRIGQLDVALTWLWRVHGVDYYGGVELLSTAEFESRLQRQRTLRGPKPEEGEEADEETGGACASWGSWLLTL